MTRSFTVRAVAEVDGVVFEVVTIEGEYRPHENQTHMVATEDSGVSQMVGISEWSPCSALKFWGQGAFTRSTL